MRTTIDLPDSLYREAKLTAVARGIPFKTLVAEGVARMLQQRDPGTSEPAWKRHVGTLSQEAAEEMERFLADADFSRVDPQDTEEAGAA